MQKRSAVLVLVLFLAACGSAQVAPPGADSSVAPAAGGAGGTASKAPGSGATQGPAGGVSLADAAAKVTDWCALIPNDVVARFAPSAPPAAAGTNPGECLASNGVGALDFQYHTGFGAFEIPAATELVQGLGQGAYLDRPSKDEVELTVALRSDPVVGIFIDVAGHDGKDHKDDAIAMAKAIIARLGGV